MYKLKDLCVLITDGEHGTVTDDVNGTSFLLSNKNIENGDMLISDNDRKISIKTMLKLNKRTQINKNTILISTVGTIGKTAYIRSEEINYAVQRSVGIIKANNALVNPYYLYCLLQTNSYQNKLNQMASGSVQKCLFISNLEDLDIIIPEREKQDRIAETIQNIDDLIIKNNSIIKSLSNKIKDSYTYYCLKANGNKKPLSDFLELENDGYNGSENLPLIDLSIMPSDSLVINNFNESSKLTTNLKKLSKGNYLFGSIRPYLKKSIVSPIDGLTTGTVIQMKPKNNNYRNLLLGILTSNHFYNFTINNSTGTKMPVIKGKDLLNYEFMYDPDLIMEFEKNNNFIDLIIKLLNENQKLNELKNLQLNVLFE